MYGSCFLTNCLEAARERKSGGTAKKVGRLCVHFICLPPFLPADFKERQGRTHKGIVEDTEFSSLKISLEISKRDE
jgi:hypothetical protein